MKRTFHSTEPNYRALAKLYQKQSFVAEVSCRVWLPRHLHERPFLSFESTDLDRQQLELSSPEYDVVISIFDFDGELRTNLHATNMFVTNFVVSTQGAQQPPRITFQGEPARIVKSESLVPQTEGELNTEFVLYITHNSFLSPHTVIERSYTGEVKVKKLRVHKDSIGPFENVIFDRHYYEVKLNDGGVGVYDKLAVILRSKCPADDVALFETEIKPVVDDYLLLSSFAANQWTNIVAWQAYDNKYAVDGWYGNVQVDTNQDTSPHRQESCLIELLEFEEFLKVATKKFESFGTDSREVIRQAIYKVLPRGGRTIESSILSFFSAVESIILVHRRAKDLEFTISKNNHWRKLEQSLRDVIQNNANLFATPEHMSMLMKMVPSLRRVPLRDAFESYIYEHEIDLSDLWPVFDSNEGAALADIRNRLIHGDVYDERNWLPLCHAISNLECIAKRMIMTILGYDIARSNVSKDVLRRRGWLPNANLAADMKVLANG